MQRVAVVFINVGAYHAARLNAAHDACQQQGWQMTAVQITDNTLQHPWGDLHKIRFPLETVIPASEVASADSEQQWQRIANNLVPCVLDKLNPDAIAIPGWGHSSMRAALSWARRRKSITVLMSESKRDDEARRWWKEKLKAHLYVNKFDAALVGGSKHQAYLVELGMPPEKIFTGYDIVDNDYFSACAAAAQANPFAARWRQPQIPLRPFFIAATRLLERKNIPRLIDAYAVYHAKFADAQAWDLVICGSGEQETLVRERIAAANLKHAIHLPGFVTYDAVGGWYGLAAAFVHPALQEQWGLVINEACAAGLPILCSNTVGACHELVRQDENGFKFNPKSVDEIAQALIAMHSLDADVRQGYGERSKQLVASFAPAAFGEGLVKAIRAGINK